MTVSSIDKARETWDTIDIKKVRSVSWCSLSYIGRKVAFGLSPSTLRYPVRAQPAGTADREPQERVPARAPCSVAIWSRSACYSRLTSL